MFEDDLLAVAIYVRRRKLTVEAGSRSAFAINDGDVIDRPIANETFRAAADELTDSKRALDPSQVFFVLR